MSAKYDVSRLQVFGLADVDDAAVLIGEPVDPGSTGMEPGAGRYVAGSGTRSS